MAIGTETLARMTVWIGLNKPKGEFGEMTHAESEMYDQLAHQIAEAKSKGLTVSVVADTPSSKP